MVVVAKALLPTLMSVAALTADHPPAMRILAEEALRDRVLELSRTPSGASADTRWVESVPLSLFIADRRLAMVTTSTDQPGLLIREPGYVMAMTDLFEFMWQRVRDQEPPAGTGQADPAAAPGPPQDRRAAVLNGLAAGLTDAALANRLDLTERTVRRDVSALMHRAGAVSRFQLGARAQSLGWLRDHPG